MVFITDQEIAGLSGFRVVRNAGNWRFGRNVEFFSYFLVPARILLSPCAHTLTLLGCVVGFLLVGDVGISAPPYEMLGFLLVGIWWD